MDKKICIIGAGPCGMATLFHFSKLKQMPDVVCYEKQRTWGGLWNFSWRTGIDEHGEPCPNGMYKNLWSNTIKEMMEFPDYTFETHFGKTTPSYMPRSAMRDYLEGHWTKGACTNLKKFIEFNTAVRYVKFNDDENNFIVTVNDHNTGETREEIFSHVVVATGIFNTPNTPEIKGIGEFHGRILHAHDFRDAREFTGKRVLLIGAGYSGEDLALQLLKYNTERVILSHRTNPKSSTCFMPDGIEERPQVDRFDTTKVHFIDKTFADIDAVIFCTGYINHFPFLESRFRIDEKTHFYPAGLYKAALYIKAGNNKLFYVGVQDQFYSFHLFEVLTNWTVKYIMGQLEEEPRSKEEMETDAKDWHSRCEAIRSENDMLEVQSDLVDHLANLGGYTKDIMKTVPYFRGWIQDRKEKDTGLANYRDMCYANIHSGIMAPKQTPFMENYDDSIEAYLKFGV
ncbi:trimethylamine monooxygenase-like [Ruditapes philippinarum]|uniref:trimethylamine monooxygenase-like n=1 Tax=Ruditapes philippinarum TaxID=129788 RepID=UPI00295A69B6|nr:trimethylamine monooxygenase-like [Ruditapes philippinarum]